MSVTGIPTLSGALGQLGVVRDPDILTPQRARLTTDSPVGNVDWQLVVGMRRDAAEQIAAASAEWLSSRGQPMPEGDRRAKGRAVIRAVVHARAQSLGESGEALWPLELESRYADAVESAIFGYGRLQPLFEIGTAENIEIHGFDSVMVQYTDGHREKHPPIADSDEELVEAIRFLGETASPARPFDDLHPTMTLALGDRFRLHAIGFGLSYRPSIVIRQHLLTDVTLADLAEDGMLPGPVARLLQSAVLGRKSIVISGDQGAGKTTLLRALISAIHPNERFGTLETDYELLTHLLRHRRNVLALQARVGMGEQTGGESVGTYTVADLIPEALRQNLTRLVVGEVRGAEAGAMFEAMQSGAGTLSTTHSHSASSTIDRLAARVAQGRVMSIDDAMRQIAHHMNFVVHVTLRDDAWRGGVRRRFVSEVRQLTGAVEAGRPTTHLVYRAATDTTPELFQPEAAMAAELAQFESAARWG
ncbi:Pilus assembly protein, ATPase of CpaF family [Tessaracoccus bendigoensis DSM 12906]|uniref:Pilus assembly protein, ATPase of CpaF family n=1 Tax=Tessaracoccus bendigoensis DSM 12906 TaxID=1123357 RepID=A0A1M6E3S2_9ACTN|nr:CpaF/VirB11 family protein [Tessaracoccus bendigoensis]SHI80101.1 Pilus assembly protein, ATPase of CpaF family [Tessaracoccus bendigoensis DSM 12906]